ncbi:MAG: extracellular solute-binding protein [Cyanobacteriota bacterium]|nr:extracellular solute-binding protein [Cyanobacteriota bacterium]
MVWRFFLTDTTQVATQRGLACLATLSITFLTAAAASAGEAVETLRVLLYPYVPHRLALFQKIEHQFEKDHPGINLELVENDAIINGYYSGELQKASADVYEVDTVLLSDMIAAGKASVINITQAGFSKEAIQAVTRDNKAYGIPRWVCGNFLFYRKGDQALEKAKTWQDVTAILKSRNQSLLVDFKGKSTLGEWYFTALAQLKGVNPAQAEISSSAPLNQDVVNSLNGIVAACPDGYCRSNDLHDRTGFYARAFISGQSSAYVGYSESIHYGLQYALDNCTQTSGCLSPDQIAVRDLPAFTQLPKSRGMGWVDALTIDASLQGAKRQLATKFIDFMVSDATYKSILKPEYGEAPRYLLPAKENISIEDAPLYPSFYQAHRGRDTGSRLGLNEKLRAAGKSLDCGLAIDRNDAATKQACQK